MNFKDSSTKSQMNDRDRKYSTQSRNIYVLTMVCLQYGSYTWTGAQIHPWKFPRNASEPYNHGTKINPIHHESCDMRAITCSPDTELTRVETADARRPLQHPRTTIPTFIPFTRGSEQQPPRGQTENAKRCRFPCSSHSRDRYPQLYGQDKPGHPYKGDHPSIPTSPPTYIPNLQLQVYYKPTITKPYQRKTQTDKPNTLAQTVLRDKTHIETKAKDTDGWGSG